MRSTLKNNSLLRGEHVADTETTKENSFVNSVSQGEGAPVLMIHGLAASLHDWDELFPPLVEAGFSGHALDLLGHGDSFKPRDVEEYTVETVYEHMLGWIDSLTLNQPAVLIGHSLGGALAMLYALRFPERVRGLVLIDPFFNILQLPPVMRVVYQRHLIKTTMIDITPYWLFRVLVDVSSFNYYFDNGETHVLPEHVRYQTALDFKRASSGIYHIPNAIPELNIDLSIIKQPALVLWGQRDSTLDPQSFSRLVEMLPNACGESFRLCGHVPHQCHPEQLNPLVLKFLMDL